MGEFFKPWRRKIGVLTLLMACVFMAGWIRAYRFVDVISFAKTQSTTTFLSSSPGRLGWSTVGHPFDGRLIKWESIAAQPHDYAEPAKTPDGTVSSYGAFYFISCHPPTRTTPLFSTLVVRYWAVTFLLTLLSTFLLLFKPRSSTQKKIAEPISIEGK